MNIFSRRQFFRGASALSVAALTGAITGCGGPKYLNVVIHGLSALIVQPQNTDPMNGITLFCPEITDTNDCYSHSYLCGNLVYGDNGAKNLISMPRDYDYRLEGVHAGDRPIKDSFDASINVVFEPKTITAAGAGKRTFTLPWPASVMSLGIMERTDGLALVQDNSPISNNKSLYWSSTITVLVYKIKSTPKILWANKDIGWKPVPTSDEQFANFHIFAEPKGVPDPDHAISAFKKLMGSLSIPQGSLDNYVAFNRFSYARQLPDAVVPPGLDRKLDLQHLHHFYSCLTQEGGEMANCIRALVFVG